MTELEKQNLKKSLCEKWPSSIVARDQIKAFSGGAICGRSVANMESLGNGREPGCKFYLGKRAVYPADKLADWLVDQFMKVVS